MAQNLGSLAQKTKLNLASKLLIANNRTSFVDRPVVLIVSHDESGALGFALNQPVGLVPFHEIFRLTSAPLTGVEYSGKTEVLMGGYYERGRCFVLHSPDYSENYLTKINNDILLTSDHGILKEIARGKGPEKRMVLIGLSKWDPGELEEDLFNNNWIVCEPTTELIFFEDTKNKWLNALSTNGVISFSYPQISGSC